MTSATHAGANERWRTRQSETVAKADDETITPTSETTPAASSRGASVKNKNGPRSKYSAFDARSIANSAASASSSGDGL
jgi:hypothetical protein